MSKLHHTIAKLERILFMPLLLFWGMHFSFGYTLFIWVCNFFWVCNFWGVCPFNLSVYTHFIWVCNFFWVCTFLGVYMPFQFECIYTFYLGMQFLCGYICTFHLGVHFSTVKCACAYMHPEEGLCLRACAIAMECSFAPLDSWIAFERSLGPCKTRSHLL